MFKTFCQNCKEYYRQQSCRSPTILRKRINYKEAVCFLPLSFQKSLVLSQPWSQPWSNPMVLNKRPLDWESSTLTTRPFLHKLKRAGKYKILKSIIKLKYHWLLQYTNFDIIPLYAYLLYFLVHTLSSIWVFSRDLFRTLSNI